jgi:hypothetical protein
MTKYDFLIQSIADLDIDSVDMMLDEHRTYQDMEKKKFVRRLKDVMTDFMTSGDHELIAYSGTCGSCVKGCKGYAFVGPHSMQHLDLIIQYDGENITDIFSCALLKLDHVKNLGERLLVKSDYQFPELGIDPPPF